MADTGPSLLWAFGGLLLIYLGTAITWAEDRFRRVARPTRYRPRHFAAT